MTIQNISFTDKVNGATDTTGQVSAADLNEIKAKANAGIAFLNAIAGLFTLDNNGLPVAVKNSALPGVDIFTNNFSSDFVVSGGLISLAGSALPVPPPLTNGVVDDTANTFTGTLPAGYAATDLEATFNGGTTWATITALPLSVGDVAYAIGQVGLRIKANSQRQHSATLYNATAFTASGGGSNPDAGFTKVILGSNDTLGQSVTQQAAPNNNNYDFANPGNGGGAPYGFLTLHTPTIASGGTATIRATSPVTKSSFLIGVDTAYPSGTQNSLKASIKWIRSSDTSGKFQSIVAGSYHDGSVINITVAPRMQVRMTGTRIYLEYSLDGGTTWTDFLPGTNIAQPAVVLYLAGYSEGYTSPADDTGIVNIIQTGMQ